MLHRNLWAPWRMVYLDNLDRQASETERLGRTEQNAATNGSFLDDYWTHPENDDAQLVIHRSDRGMILLNRYPYAGGHLLVALGEARPRLVDYQADQRRAFWSLVDFATHLCHETLRPQGVNLGINEGEAAGAGVPDHLHAHVIPRWAGDTNFITAVGQVRVVPQALEQTAARYRSSLAKALESFDGEL